ncbi:hypothetical protein QGP82_09015 [Leptothoe sp. LEGE 181152]|nr:hypothetical protein [Leptothoe sp. LEGE 181152]
MAAHPYEEWLVNLQHKVNAAISVGLLDRLIDIEKPIVSEKLNYILDNNNIWNALKDLNGFKKNEKIVTNTLIHSTRKLLLYKQLRLSLCYFAGSLKDSDFINRILAEIPCDATSVMLEELLDIFMKNEISRLSSQEENPIIKDIKKAEAESKKQKDDNKKGEWIAISIGNDLPTDPNSVDEEITRVQNIKQSKSYSSSPSSPHDEKEGSIIINSELGGYIHPTLKQLYNARNNRSNLAIVDDYLYRLGQDSNIKLYIDRPIYKLALRVRNILIFSYSNNDQLFSNSGIEDAFKVFKKVFFENIEIYLFLALIQNQENKNESLKFVEFSIRKILQKIFYKITAKPISRSVKLPENIDQGSSEYMDLLSKSLLDKHYPALTDYEGISLQELTTSVDSICTRVTNLFNSIEKAESLRIELVNIFIEIANQIAKKNETEFIEDGFESRFFGSNSSNILLELSRRFLSYTSIPEKEFNDLIDRIFAGDEYIGKIHKCLHKYFGKNYSWNVYFPIRGIAVTDKSIDSYFHELATSLSETHEIKFLSPEILKTISIEVTSSIKDGPMVFIFENATACASFEGIEAGDSQQAFKIAMSQLFDAMEAQWYLSQHGHQYKVEPLVENSKVMAFCKKIYDDDSFTSSWWISQISHQRPGVFPYQLNQKTQLYLAVPARKTKILTQRAAASNPLGEIARNILHCIKLFRKGYFTENLSERFRLYWTILDTLFAADTFSNQTTKALVPYSVSLFRLGVNQLIEPGNSYLYRQARLWMREDIEDLYTFVRNPLIHDGVENTVAYERLMKRFESIVSSILRELSDIVIYKDWPDSFLAQGMEGIIKHLEICQPSQGQILPISKASEDE